MIDWSQVSREEMIEASRRSLRVDNAGLEHVLTMALDNEPNRQRDLERGRGGIGKRTITQRDQRDVSIATLRCPDTNQRCVEIGSRGGAPFGRPCFATVCRSLRCACV